MRLQAIILLAASIVKAAPITITVTAPAITEYVTFTETQTHSTLVTHTGPPPGFTQRSSSASATGSPTSILSSSSSVIPVTKAVSTSSSSVIPVTKAVSTSSSSAASIPGSSSSSTPAAIDSSASSASNSLPASSSSSVIVPSSSSSAATTSPTSTTPASTTPTSTTPTSTTPTSTTPTSTTPTSTTPTSTTPTSTTPTSTTPKPTSSSTTSSTTTITTTPTTSSKSFSTTTTSTVSPSSTSTTVVIVTVTSSSAPVPTLSDQAFNDEILQEHNAKRALHGVNPLVWDSKLADYAATYAAAHFDCNNVQLIHSGGPYGENLAAGYLGATLPVDAWYDEISQYNYDKPGFSEQTGHFTQVVWKATGTLGCARVMCLNIWRQYTICEYSDQRGNVVGTDANGNNLFAVNVLPLL